VKRRKAPNLKRLLKRLSGALILLALLLCGAADWCAHQPRRWQQAQASRLPAPLGEWAARLGDASADFTDTLGLTGTDATAPLPASLATNRILCAGFPRRLPNGPAPDDIQILDKTKSGFIVGYSPSLRHPVWVAYRVSATTNSVPPPRPRDFKPDPATRNAPLGKDYAKSGYDRGHMAPNLAIATRYGKSAQLQTFLTSNICPQRPGLNQGPWCNLEFRISELWPARFGEVWILTGAISDPNGKRLPSGVDIPTAFYQVVLARDNGRLRAFATLMPQNVRRRAYARASLVSIDEVEALAGLDLLSDLPDDVESALEAATPTRLWPAGPLGAFKLLRERFRTYD
jgi:DNA/RNA endonuclease G (NUC1)